jgi:hypothetical protein
VPMATVPTSAAHVTERKTLMTEGR